MKNSRYIALLMIKEVLANNTLNKAIKDVSIKCEMSEEDRAFVQSLSYGICRYYSQLAFIVNQILEKPLKAKDEDLFIALLIGIYQLKFMRVPDHAAVSETVELCHLLKKTWAKGLLNAVFRTYIRERAKIESLILENEAASYSFPKWWIRKIKKDWPDHWQSILTQSNEQGPLALRINQKIITREKYLQLLAQENIEAVIIPETETGILLKNPMNVEKLPGYSQGLFSVQDGAAQLALSLLQISPQQHILDACAAPGGKLTHILESSEVLKSITALEKDKNRILKIEDNLTRLKLNTPKLKLICHDAKNVEAWWDGLQFDRILLDAPCTASGVLRRHPDIKILRCPDDLTILQQEQLSLLQNLWVTLKPGGMLLYATCSIFPEENELVLATFLKNMSTVEEERIARTFGLSCKIGLQILPGMHNMDGFYYALLRKLM